MLITLLIVALVAVIAFYIVKQIPLPPPINMIVQVIVGILLLIYLFSKVGISLP
jgi:hypothetical protein